MINALIDYYFIKLLFIVCLLPIEHTFWKWQNFQNCIEENHLQSVHMRACERVCGLFVLVYLFTASNWMLLAFFEFREGESKKSESESESESENGEFEWDSAKRWVWAWKVPGLLMIAQSHSNWTDRRRLFAVGLPIYINYVRWSLNTDA